MDKIAVELTEEEMALLVHMLCKQNIKWNHQSYDENESDIMRDFYREQHDKFHQTVVKLNEARAKLNKW